jgi:hypothetical protein
MSDPSGGVKDRRARLVVRAATRCRLEDFPALPTVGHNSWLSHNREPGQTFDAFASRGDRHVPDARHRVIYLQPFGPGCVGGRRGIARRSRLAL